MPKTIIQTVRFNAKPEALYALYADSRRHTEAVGVKSAMTMKPGGKWQAFDGDLSGTTLATVRNRVIVQTWRSGDWGADQADSLLTLFFEKDGRGSKLTMVHANIPDERYAGIKSGWTTYYWTPWKKMIARGKAR